MAKKFLSGVHNPYKFQVYRNGAQTINTGADRQINFETEVYDTGGNYNTTNFNFTVPVTGFYRFESHVACNTTASATRILMQLYVNGSAYIRLGDEKATSPNGVGGGTKAWLTAGDTVDIRVQPVGANIALTVGASPMVTWFSGEYCSKD